MATRTIRDFASATSIWPSVEAWAKESDYRLQHEEQTTRLYQRGYGLMTAPMMLELSQKEGQVHLEAWIRVPLLNRVSALFLVPAQMGIESGGFRLVVPRNIARKAVNKLLVQLGQPPIE